MVLDSLDVLFRERAVERVDLRRADARALALAEELDALGRAVGALVELARQRLDGKDGGSAAASISPLVRSSCGSEKTVFVA